MPLHSRQHGTVFSVPN